MKRIKKHDITELSVHLDDLDPDAEAGDWSTALMVIYNETDGSEEGFALVDEWSSRGTKYQGTDDVRRYWKSFKPNHKNPVLLGTLIWLARRRQRA